MPPKRGIFVCLTLIVKIDKFASQLKTQQEGGIYVLWLCALRNQ